MEFNKQFHNKNEIKDIEITNFIFKKKTKKTKMFNP